MENFPVHHGFKYKASAGPVTCYKKKEGFTLVELLIVVAIIAVLAAIAVPQFTKYRLRAYKTQLDSDTKNAYTAAQAYLADYPTTTITVIGQLNAGGYQRSAAIVFINASMSQSGGKIELYSNMLNSIGYDNNSVGFANGTLLLVNMP